MAISVAQSADRIRTSVAHTAKLPTYHCTRILMTSEPTTPHTILCSSFSYRSSLQKTLLELPNQRQIEIQSVKPLSCFWNISSIDLPAHTLSLTITVLHTLVDWRFSSIHLCQWTIAHRILDYPIVSFKKPVCTWAPRQPMAIHCQTQSSAQGPYVTLSHEQPSLQTICHPLPFYKELSPPYSHILQRFILNLISNNWTL